MRISDGRAIGALLLLAACGERKVDREVIARADARQDAAAADDGRVQCAPAGAAEFARACTLDREEGRDGLILTVRNPDGGFHRLRVTTDGRGVVAADGAEAAAVSVQGDGIEVAIGKDRYRLPATVR